MKQETCIWVAVNPVAYDTECGHYYNRMIDLSCDQPSMETLESGEEVCPWCGKIIEFEDEEEEEYDE